MKPVPREDVDARAHASRCRDPRWRQQGDGLPGAERQRAGRPRDAASGCSPRSPSSTTRPSATAQRLSSGRTLTISVVTSYLTRPQAAERLRGVDAVLGDSGFDQVIYNVETVEKRDQYLRGLAPRPADGWTAGHLAAAARRGRERLSSAAIPVVVVDAHAPAVEGLPHVVGDDIGGGEARRPATCWSSAIGGSRTWETSSTTPSGSPRAGIGSRGTSGPWRLPAWGCGRSLVVLGAHSRYEARELAAASWRSPTGPPRSSLPATRRPWASSPRPARPACASPTTCRWWATTTSRSPITSGLTTVRQGLFESGRIGAELLLAEIRERSGTPVSVVLPPELVVRGTTAPVKEG